MQELAILKNRKVFCNCCNQLQEVDIQFICMECHTNEIQRNEKSNLRFKDLPNVILNQQQDSDSISTRSIDEVSIKSVGE
jgi:hypothetical protein